MKAHTQEFKEEIKLLGKQLDSIISYEIDGVAHIISAENINSVTPVFSSNILKSAMKELDINVNNDIPLKTVVNYKFGVLINGEYEYLNFGNYTVYSSEKEEATNSYNIVCYDKMLNSMKEYEALEIEYPITVRDYINAICEKIDIVFANKDDEFANYDKVLQNELYLDSNDNSLGYTYRDVLDELAQVTASTICINDNDELEIRYINDTDDTINEEYLKDVNVNFGEKYGPVNSIVLSRSAESDNVYLQDEESIEENGLCELKIVDNQIMNWNDRSDYLPDLLNKLDGLQYYINDFSSTGITYYDLCDRYNVEIGENVYSCIMLNDEINVTQGLEEIIYTDMMTESQAEYTKADKTDRRINETWLIVNKQEGQIEAFTNRITILEEGGIDSYTKEEVNQLIQTAETGLVNTFTNSGGNNLLRNTAPWFMESTNTAEFWVGNIKQVVETEASSGYAILTQSGNASQSVALTNENYSLSFKYKKLIDGAECQVRYNGKTFNLTEDYGEIHSSGQITNGQLIFEIIANSNNGFEIYDLMLKRGTEGLENMLVWTQNANESISDTIQISKGIKASSTATNTDATMDSGGFKVRNRTTGVSVMEATSTGGLFMDLTSTGKSNLSGLLIRKSGGLIKINGESD